MSKTEDENPEILTERNDPATLQEEIEQNIFTLVTTYWVLKMKESGPEAANESMITMLNGLINAFKSGMSMSEAQK